MGYPRNPMVIWCDSDFADAIEQLEHERAVFQSRYRSDADAMLVFDRRLAELRARRDALPK